MDIEMALSNAHSFSELWALTSRAEAKLSSWGRECVSVQGYEGISNVDVFAFKTIELLKKLNYEFSEQERSAGGHLANKIDHMYNDTSVQVMNSSCPIRILHIINRLIETLSNKIKGIPSSISHEWHCLGDTYNEDFDFYTEKQLQTVFGISKEEAEKRGYPHEEKNGIHRWQPPVEQSQPCRAFEYFLREGEEVADLRKRMESPDGSLL